MISSVYVLYSLRRFRTYVGLTDDLPRRLVKYNSGKVISTNRFQPWTLIYTEQFDSRGEALRREKWFKRVASRRYLKVMVSRWKRTGLSDPATRDRDLVPPKAERTKPA
jgi:putative endonuclease